MSGEPLWVVETKTSTDDVTYGSTYWKRLAMDEQIGIYVHAGRALGLNITGVLYDVLVPPGCQPRMSTPVELRKYTKPTKKDPVSRLYQNQRETDESAEEFYQRCLDTIAAEPNKFYVRGEVVRFDSEQSEMQKDVWATAIMMREARRLKLYPRNPSNCVSWGRECDFLSLCCNEASIDDPFLFRKQATEHEELSESATGKIRITQSRLKTFRGCPKKDYLRNVLGIRSTKEPETLRRGKSVHAGVEALRLGKTLEEAIAFLDQRDPYKLAKERAMLVGYLAFWGAPEGIVAVEKEFEIDLVNPETGAASRLFSLAGKIDAVCLADRKYLQPAQAAPAGPASDSFEELLEKSIAAVTDVGPGPEENDACE